MVERQKTQKTKDQATTQYAQGGCRLSQSAKELRDKIKRIISQAQSEHREALTELEGMSILAAMGVQTPRRWIVQSANEFLEKIGAEGAIDAPLQSPFPGSKAVIKVISSKVLHKTEVQGIEIVDNTATAIADSLDRMEARFKNVPRDGFTVNEFIAFEPKLGHEMILGYRFTPDFGPIVTFGPGGIYTEYLASKFKPGMANLFLSPRINDIAVLESLLRNNVIYGLLCAGLRNTRPELEEKSLIEAIQRFIDAADALSAAGISEFEVNPMVLSKTGELVALDCLATLKEFAENAPANGSAQSSSQNLIQSLVRDSEGFPINFAQHIRPVNQIKHILEPSSVAIIGVSEKTINNGRIILRNLLENNFDKSRIYIIKPGAQWIDGCQCVPDVQSLPEKIDLFVVVIPALGIPSTLADIARYDKAWSVLLIPGGLEEKQGSESIVADMNRALAEARAEGKGPLINGGNCLGIRSVPGKYNTLFIPEYKLPMPKGKIEPLALISQSGAFAITRISKHPNINAKYAITIGNQMDLTVGDYLDYLAQDNELHVFAVYSEGFKPLDGQKALEATKEITMSGRNVILYRGGRTRAGAGAAASHTASIAGDYPVTWQLFSQAGAVVCDSLDEFDDAITLFTLLDGKRAKGRRLAAVSNGGYECVAIADNLGEMVLSHFSERTKTELEVIYKDAHISEIVDIHNPLDLTPMADDDAYERAVRTVLMDPETDLCIVGIIPLTAKLNTLAGGPLSHGEDILRPNSLPERLGRLSSEMDKPFIAIVDSGPLYDPFSAELEKRGIPTFRAADRALRMLERWRKAHQRI